jgi:Ca2+-binding RTX toxin-like protein
VHSLYYKNQISYATSRICIEGKISYILSSSYNNPYIWNISKIFLLIVILALSLNLVSGNPNNLKILKAYAVITGTQDKEVSPVKHVITCAGNVLSPNICVGTQHDDTIIGTGGSDTIYGKGGDDQIQGQGLNDVIYGGRGNDAISGGDGTDTLFGQEGDDTLSADSGPNVLSGGGGDLMNGGPGNDKLIGSLGNDIMIGGPGRDFFDCGEGTDVIIDYNPNEDTKLSNCEFF